MLASGKGRTILPFLDQIHVHYGRFDHSCPLAFIFYIDAVHLF